ncbi:3-hydroxyacyl-CoA dehydrogenase [Novosphingobium percolationis]|uniref:3-hydroxyacyl-CoA dehydrogenase n=1 Tax=Novosphingobium percolationis TaxID=2871811 RepID=UPI001CD65101|nr:3-hydroxyacyl-CoA dehydrogenase [Novosphingobium percolationis]
MSDIKQVGVCGAGAMGSGIAQVAAQAGHTVVVYDVFAPSRERSREQIAKGLGQLAKRGKLSEDEATAILARLSWTDDVSALAGCDLVIEAIIEDLTVKQALFGQLEEQLRPDAIIASNTSSLPIARLARSLLEPGRFVGMHFFNPATAMKLVEVVSGPATAPAVAEAIADLARAWGKVAVPVADVPGFIVNRVARPFYAEAFRCLQQQGAQAAVIDQLFRAGAGFRMGPLELTDLIGQDVNFAVARSVYESYFGQTRFTPQLVQSALVDANWLGRKTGRGIYDYADGAAVPTPVPVEAAELASVPAKPEGALPRADKLDIGGVLVRFSRGRTARAESAEAGRPVALLDWFDAASASAAAFAASDEAAAAVAASVLHSWGLAPYCVADRPGLIVLRTLAQIANAAGDAVLEGVSDEAGIDNALRFGANYPFGPIAWGRQMGAGLLVQVLAAMAAETGQPMYNPSEYWMTKA